MRKKPLWAFVVLIVVFNSANATQVPECYEESRRPYWRFLERIVPPEPGIKNDAFAEFCDADVHQISESMPIASEPLQCYTSGRGELVIELPNEYFNSCINPEELIHLYALKWAYYSFDSVDIVVYSTVHKFIQTASFPHDHPVFESARIFKEVQAVGGSFDETLKEN